MRDERVIRPRVAFEINELFDRGTRKDCKLKHNYFLRLIL